MPDFIHIQKAIGTVMGRVPEYPWTAFCLMFYGLVSLVLDVVGLFL